MREKPVHAKDIFLGRAPGPLQRLISDQRVLFLLIGGANTVFSTALFVGLIWLLGPGVPAAVSLVIAWGVSLILVFFVYRKLVFRVIGNLWIDLVRFASVNFMGLLVNSIALTCMTEYAKLPAIPCQLAITVVVVLFNYFGHKHFSFRR
jgi:putative flippase GtrA